MGVVRRSADWFLSAAERGNPASWLYRDRGAEAWTPGNRVQALVDGATYFSRLREELLAVGSGDQVYFADWRGDPEERLDGPGTAVMVELARAQSAGGQVFGLVWRSHLDSLRFSEKENRTLVEALQAIDAVVLLDMRVRRGGSHHQKFVVIRHPGQPERDAAFVGGTDLCHSRRDDHRHRGDPQPVRMSRRYGPTPPWHDAMVEIRGPAVADVERCFRERWADPTALQHAQPVLWVADKLRGLRDGPRRLPDPLPPPPPMGSDAVQLLRTYPAQRPPYPFAPKGERTVARGYLKVLSRAETLVYVEDQYLWSRTVAAPFADALRRSPRLHLVAVLPRFPDAEGRLAEPAADAARAEAIALLRQAGQDRVHIFDLENDAGTPIYVHAKVCIVEDVWAAVGSANLNRRSWTHDSELTAAVLTEPPGDSFALALRMGLWAEHLGRDPRDPASLRDLRDPATGIMALHESAQRLQLWRVSRLGSRPPGALVPHRPARQGAAQRRALEPFNRVVADPDGRPWSWRVRNRW